jgi:hypothetical protein
MRNMNEYIVTKPIKKTTGSAGYGKDVSNDKPYQMKQQSLHV